MNPAKKSVEIIKKLQTKQGGILATFENDAYPYVYPRDGVIMTKALNLHSEYKHSKKFYLSKVAFREGFIPEHIALEKDYLEWKENEIEFSERIIHGMRRAEHVLLQKASQR